jgi:hypothetical protein
MTTVNVAGTTTGFQSISWNYDRQPTRLWQLGNWGPYKTQIVTSVTLNLTTYASVIMPRIVLSPSTDCSDSSKMRIIFSAAACDPASSVNFDMYMYLTSYSYAKEDSTGFATESWAFQAWIDSGLPSSSSFIYVPAPSVVLEGISEGSRSGDVGNGTTDLGIVFLAPESSHVVTGQQGSVSAGFPGVGNADTISLGIVSEVGAGLLEAAGRTGRSSAQIPRQPLYLP